MSVYSEQLKQEMAKIRAAYSWLEENTIRHYAEQVLKAKHIKNEDI